MRKGDSELNPFGSQNPFNQMNQQQFSTDYLNDIRKMVDHYNSVLNEDFWNSINGMGQSRKKQSLSWIPIEMWENDEYLFVLVVAPGIKEPQQVKVTILSESQISIDVFIDSLQPPVATKQIMSDLSQKEITRSVQLPYEVNMNNYNITIENGLAFITFYKQNNKVEVPFDF